MDAGMGGGAGGFDMGGDMGMDMGGEAGTPDGALDINELGEVGKISENTSEELPNLGGNETEPVDETIPPA